MDPVSHLLFGRALAAVTPRPAREPGRAPGIESGRGLTAAIVIGSIVPDVDAVLMPFGWDRYLLWHQRGTHALIGTAIDALVLALVMHAAWRLRLRRGSPPAPRGLHLALAAWIGCLGHALLDLVSGGTIRLLAPFTTVPFGVPWTAMADPLIAVPLVLFFLATLVWRRHTRTLALATLMTLAAVVGVKEESRRLAMGAYAQAIADDSGRPEGSALEAAWGSFTRWWAFDRLGPHLRTWEVDAWTGTARLRASRDTRRGAAPATEASSRATRLIDASTRLDTVRHLHSLFDLTFAEVRPRGDETDVLWSDIRFCDDSDCALWFGGTFDASDTLRQQLVIAGTLRQARAP